MTWRDYLRNWGYLMLHIKKQILHREVSVMITNVEMTIKVEMMTID